MTIVLPGSVLVLGASGYISLAVARAFRKAGYHVYGLIRSEGNKSLLLSNEIVPVIGDGAKVEQYKEYIEGCSVIVECTSTMTASGLDQTLPLTVLKAVEEALKIETPYSPPRPSSTPRAAWCTDMTSGCATRSGRSPTRCTRGKGERWRNQLLTWFTRTASCFVQAGSRIFLLSREARIVPKTPNMRIRRAYR